MMVIMRENEAIRTEVSWGNLNPSKFDEIILNLPSMIGPLLVDARSHSLIVLTASKSYWPLVAYE